MHINRGLLQGSNQECRRNYGGSHVSSIAAAAPFSRTESHDISAPARAPKTKLKVTICSHCPWGPWGQTESGYTKLLEELPYLTVPTPLH